MNVKEEIMRSDKIAYIRRMGEYGIENKIQMEQLKEWARKNKFLNDAAIILGIAQDNPSLVKPQACRYDVGIVIPEDYKINGSEVEIGAVIGGKYAVFEIEHTAVAVQKAWSDIFNEIPKRGYQLDESRPIIERYQMKLVNNHLCEICVPVH